MTSALKSWWPLATAGGATAGAGGAAPTEELEDLDAILQVRLLGALAVRKSVRCCNVFITASLFQAG